MKSLLSVGLLIVVCVVLRIIPHIPNVTPVAALALFGGVYFNKRSAIIVPLLSMVLSDIFLGLHPTMVFVYGSFVLTSILGMVIKNKKNGVTIITASLLSSVLFFVITNFGVWLIGAMYSHTSFGLLEAYINGLPFLRNTILGDLFYTTIFFTGYEIIKVLKERKVGSANLYKNWR